MAWTAFRKLCQIAYATALLAVVTATPRVVLHLELEDETTSATLEFPTFGADFMFALALTVLAVSPTLLLPPRLMYENPKLGLITALPWASSALTHFISNFSIYFRAVVHLARNDEIEPVFSGVVIYTAFFLCSFGQVEIWLDVYSHLRKEYLLKIY